MRNLIFNNLLATTVVGLMLVQPTQSDDSQPATFDKWGQFVDPDRDCQAELKDGKLTITVPGKLHDLNKSNAMNAPRVVQQIDGDFEMTVRLSGAFKLGSASTLSSGLMWNSAGLLLWHDEGNYIRLERNLMGSGSRTYCYPPYCEIQSEGKYRGISKKATTEPYFKGEATWLRLKREGDYFKPSLSHDGKGWEELGRFEAILPDKIMVGVSAVNTCNEPHVVTFDELTIRKGV